MTCPPSTSQQSPGCDAPLPWPACRLANVWVAVGGSPMRSKSDSRVAQTGPRVGRRCGGQPTRNKYDGNRIKPFLFPPLAGRGTRFKVCGAAVTPFVCWLPGDMVGFPRTTVAFPEPQSFPSLYTPSAQRPSHPRDQKPTLCSLSHCGHLPPLNVCWMARVASGRFVGEGHKDALQG